ncbi:MAG: hypothetical protein GTO45_30685 [Candidatus Aminicenantes bacterium]|nr:hypothetical protein [Candidatus Aminicenantes bacterium]NIM83159.1 hypothetical protein [Candidatus Aminicenantes bacterium]NIN22535.1 hypothetical protein [Candidatus Aminicenantes bacterium]NIN46306.1 hypothetical protein [Candidatus Aminicenantes bacterium]NIN89145.1 hypothetical protein [Candidatus Aminicenantes bacterium]
MRERMCVAAKKPEEKRDGNLSKERRTNFSQPQLISPVAERILYLQRTIGNEAVQELIRSGAVQAELERSMCPLLDEEECPLTRNSQEGGVFPEHIKENYFSRFPIGAELDVADDILYHVNGANMLPERLYQGSGSCWCDTATGTPATSVTEHCAGNCVQQHENVHAGDISACCAGYKRCIDSGGANCASRWSTWVNAIRDWTECNAYTREISCLSSLIGSGCGVGGAIPAACCTTLRSELATATRRQTSHCAASSHTACPFP